MQGNVFPYGRCNYNKVSINSFFVLNTNNLKGFFNEFDKGVVLLDFKICFYFIH